MIEEFCSHTMRQKSSNVWGMGPCVAMKLGERGVSSWEENIDEKHELWEGIRIFNKKHDLKDGLKSYVSHERSYFSTFSTFEHFNRKDLKAFVTDDGTQEKKRIKDEGIEEERIVKQNYINVCSVYIVVRWCL